MIDRLPAVILPPTVAEFQTLNEDRNASQLVANNGATVNLTVDYFDAGTGDPTTGTDNCGNILMGVVRDFKGINEPGGHPDFEAFSGKDVTTGLVGAGALPSVWPCVCLLGSRTGTTLQTAF